LDADYPFIWVIIACRFTFRPGLPACFPVVQANPASFLPCAGNTICVAPVVQKPGNALRADRQTKLRSLYWRSSLSSGFILSDFWYDVKRNRATLPILLHPHPQINVGRATPCTRSYAPRLTSAPFYARLFRKDNHTYRAKRDKCTMGNSWGHP